MTEEIRKLKEIIESSNVNFLIGAGGSMPFLPILGDIEKKIEEARDNDKKVIEQFKKYFDEVMYPCSYIASQGKLLKTADKTKFDTTYNGYTKFFNSINKILLSRKGSLLNKQANIFTTNIDIFIEKVLEDMNLEYNDGFNGNINPVFQTSNFHKSIHKTSSHFGNISEIPTFNIIKLHGSLSWKNNPDGSNLIYSRLEMLDNLKELDKDDVKFLALYSDLQIVNPSKDKFKKTVMGITHYELLRMYSNELERENSVLFILGFSMTDEHIREITLRVVNSNPTLKVYIFSYSNCKEPDKCAEKPVEDRCSYHKYTEWFGSLKYKNVEILRPINDKKYNIETITAEYLEPIVSTVNSELNTENKEADIELEESSESSK